MFGNNYWLEGAEVVREISAAELARKQAAGEAIVLIDVRQPWEHEIVALANSQLLPLAELAERAGEIAAAANATVVVYCHHGIRSRSAVLFLEQQGMARVCSLAGGIDAWSLEIDPSLPRY
jgi:rhodanese-related sulfurtransferase